MTMELFIGIIMGRFGADSWIYCSWQGTKFYPVFSAGVSDKPPYSNCYSSCNLSSRKRAFQAERPWHEGYSWEGFCRKGKQKRETGHYPKEKKDSQAARQG